MKIVFAGFFAIRLAEMVRANLSIPCESIEGDETAILPKLADADVLVSMGFTPPMAEAAPHLSLVQVPGAGLDRIDRSVMRPGLRLANAYGHEAGIAEYIMGAMLSLTRSFGSLDASLRKGRWDSQWAVGTPMPPPSPELAGKTLGILGFGRIGSNVGRLGRALGMEVVAWGPTLTEERATAGGATLLPLDDVLRRADVLSVHLRLSPESRGLLSRERLALLRPTSYLVNTARGAIADETALVEMLQSGRLAGAALDVFVEEPLPRDHPLRRLDNVVLTPHVGWPSAGNYAEWAHNATEQILTFLDETGA